MAILNWRDHPRLRFVDFPPPFLTKGSVYIASDRNDSAWMSDGTAYYPLYGSGLEAPNLGVMTWAEKPAPNSVPAGTRFTASDFLMSDWQALNGYWTPVGGRAVVYNPDTTGIQAQSATAQPVAGIPGFNLPLDLLGTPGLYVEGQCVADVANISGAQSRQISIGVAASPGCVAHYLQTTLVAQSKRAWGRMHRNSNGLWAPTNGNIQLLVDNSSSATITAELLAASPVRLYYRGGNTDGSEILTVNSFSLAICIG